MTYNTFNTFRIKYKFKFIELYSGHIYKVYSIILFRDIGVYMKYIDDNNRINKIFLNYKNIRKITV